VTDTQQRDGAVTLAMFVPAASQRPLRTRLPLLVLLLLTLAVGWMDALCCLAIDRTFAPIISGNILVGLAVAQGNGALLVHAVVAVLLFLVGITLGSRYPQTLPARQPVES
jgi:uncharacterized membrane protein YoaK (UPF0700 family)